MASSDPDGLSEAARANRAFWDAQSAGYQAHNADALTGDPAWGLWRVPDTTLGVLGEVAGLDVLELGCGGAQFGIQLAQLGARLTGLDNSEQQLAHARRLQAEAGVEFPLVHSPAEQLPFAAESFDLVFCDFGAMTFGDPYPIVPAVARVLRPGGRFAFSHASPIEFLCYDEQADATSTKLQRPLFGLHSEVDEGGSVHFMLSYGGWIRLFVESGLEVERLVEWQPAADAPSTYRDEAHRDWARRWPMEEIWVVRKP